MVQPRKSRSRENNGLIAWNDLTQAEQNQFTHAFHSDEARTERRKALKEVRNFDHDVSLLLYRYQQCMELGDRVDAVASESPVIEEIWHISQGFKKDILNQLWQWMCIGDWKKIQWLAGYGEQHSQRGLLEVDKAPEKRFPQPSERLEHPQKADQIAGAGLQLATVILRSFAKMAGMRYEEAVFYSRPLGRLERMNPYLEKPLRQTGFVPEMLPTKSHLEKVALKQWQRLAGNKPKDAKSLFSRNLKKLGFAGLPKGKAASLAEESLSEEGKELREQLHCW